MSLGVIVGQPSFCPLSPSPEKEKKNSLKISHIKVEITTSTFKEGFVVENLWIGAFVVKYFA